MLCLCGQALPMQNDLDYIDDNAERLARKKIKTDSAKRLFAVNGKPLLGPMFQLPAEVATQTTPARNGRLKVAISARGTMAAPLGQQSSRRERVPTWHAA